VARRQFGDLIARGIAALQQGRYGDALVEFRAALGLRSLDAEAQSLYGLTLARLKRFDEAEPWLRKAVQREPNEAGFRFNLAELCEATRRYDAAAEQFDAIIERDPNGARAWARLGRVRALQGRHAPARDAYRRALECEPNALSHAIELCRACAALGDDAGAAAASEAAAKIAPDHPATLRLQLERLTALRNWRDLESVARRVTGAHPTEPIGWFALSRALLEQGRYRESEQAYRGVLERAGESPEHVTAHARLCLSANDLTRARALLDRAEAAAPDLPEMLAAKGLVETFFGRLDAARDYCRRSIERNPDYVPAYSQLSRLEHGRFSERDMAALERLAGDATLPVEHRASAAFAFADGVDASGDVERAFDAYVHANALATSIAESDGLGYDAGAAEAKVARLIALSSASPERNDAQREELPAPIFIVGMPRSGTTLVESLVSAHSRVFAGGERGMMQAILAEYLAESASSGAWPSQKRVKRWIDMYQREAPVPGRRIDRITDKHPLNFEAAGLIARLFPTAPMIHVRRNPIETGWSIFHHEFSKFWTFAHRLDDIGHFYGQYARLVEHWERTLGRRFVTVQYETLVADFEREARRIVAECGLDWEQRCLDFQTADRAITTFSAVQAREPVESRNGAATRYRARLGPLVQALQAAGVDLETGALLSARKAAPARDEADPDRGIRRLWHSLSRKRGN
jgi:tetratricopeptide (TPR) repeat protein